MSTFSMRLDTTQAVRAIGRLKSKAGPAVARALNRSAASAKTIMVREVSRDLGLKVGTVRDEVKVAEARPGANVTAVELSTLTARVSVSGKRIPLIEFGARGPQPSRGRGRGVTARLKGGKGRYPHAFIVRLKSGHVGVFERVPDSKRHGPKPNRSQLPVFELRGPSLPLVFAKYLPLGVARATEQLTKNLEHEFAFAMRAAAAA